MKEDNKSTELNNTDKKLHISDVISRFIVETAEKYNEKTEDIVIRLVGGNIFVVDACEIKEYKYKRALMYREINDL